MCLTRWLIILIFAMFLPRQIQAEERDVSRLASVADASRVARSEEKRTLESLARPVKFECDGLPLNEAIFQLSELMKREILFDAIGLAEGGISMDQGVSLKLGEMTVWQTLHFLLKPLHLTWVAQDGIIEITTVEKASEIFVTRVYDVKNLCTTLEPLTREMLIRQRRGKPQPAQGGGMGGGGIFRIPPVGIANATVGQFGAVGQGAGQGPMPVPAKSVESVLAEFVRGCTALTWEDSGDDAGSIQLGDGCLIVRQTYRGQFEIAGLLNALEQFVIGKVPVKSLSARRIGYPSNDDAAIFEKLATPTTIQFEDVSIEETIQQLVRETSLRFWIDRLNLNENGIDTEQTIGLRRRMQKFPLATCLKKVLEPIGMTFVVDEGVVVITSKTGAEEMMSVRLYDISGITKITNDDRHASVVGVLSRSTQGHWLEIHGNGGSAALVSSKHLGVLQSQLVHTEISLLIDDLTKDELLIPVEQPLELRVYTAPDVVTARDLERTLPQLVAKQWSIRGSIRQAGSSLFVNQPPTVHDQLDEIMGKLEESNSKRNPPPASP